MHSLHIVASAVLTVAVLTVSTGAHAKGEAPPLPAPDAPLAVPAAPEPAAPANTSRLKLTYETTAVDRPATEHAPPRSTGCTGWA